METEPVGFDSEGACWIGELVNWSIGGIKVICSIGAAVTSHLKLSDAQDTTAIIAPEDSVLKDTGDGAEA